MTDWTLGVGAGWRPIVAKAVADIEARGGTILQVKEKFGGLRLYCRSNDENPDSTVYDIADAAEKACDSICETCGKPGEVRGGGWLKNRCDECQAKHEAEHD